MNEESYLDRITGPAIDAFQNLDKDHQKDIQAYLEYHKRECLYSREDIVNACLVVQGIINFTPQIIRLFRAVYKGEEI